MKTADAAAEFLAQRRIAVTGVSRTPASHGANVVYKTLRDKGYQVAAINPNATAVEGDPCYPDLASVPGGVDAVVIATGPDHADETMQQAVDAGVRHVWMHRSVDKGSVSATATALGRRHGITVIDGGCPLMYGDVSDPGHRFMCRLFSLTGRVPRTV